MHREGDIKFPDTWSSLGGYRDMLEKNGISPTIASLVGKPQSDHISGLNRQSLQNYGALADGD